MIRAVVVPFLLVSALAGQQTWVVDANGGGDFTSVQAAVSAASDGDTVVVHFWSGLAVSWTTTTSKALTIVGVGFDRAEVHGHLVITGLAAARRFVLRSLQSDQVTGLPLSITVQDCAGAVVLDDCVFDSDHGPFSGATDTTVTIAGSGRVAIGRSALHGNVALRVTDGSVTCTGTTLRGRSIDVGPGAAAPAVVATNARLWFADAVLAGGSNGNLGGFAGPGRSGLVLAGSVATLADADVLGGHGLSGFAASVTFDAASALTVDAATWLRDGVTGDGALANGETGALSGGLAGGWSTFTLDAAPGAVGFLLLSLPGPEIATPWGSFWLRWVAAPLALGEVPVARTLPPLPFLPPGLPLAFQGVVLHDGALRLSTPLVSTVP